MFQNDLFKAVIKVRHLFAITNINPEKGAIDCYLAILSWVIKHYGQAGVSSFCGRFANGGALDPNFTAFYHSLFHRQ